MSSPKLTPEQQQRAEVLAEEGLRAAQDEIRQMAELLASKPDGQLLGGTEFQIRDLVHRAAARMIEAEVEHRQKAMTRQRAKKKMIHDNAVPGRPGGWVASSGIVPFS
jgi:hypothetical protein